MSEVKNGRYDELVNNVAFVHWYKDGLLHREDGPAVEGEFGQKYWLINGELHREDGPAVIHPEGENEWYLDGVQLSEEEFNFNIRQRTELTPKNGRFDEDGRVSYYKNGQLHREDGPAREFESGDRLWFLNGRLHREDGPAVDRADGVKIWYINGKLHREDGPAVEESRHDEWWFDGVKYNEESFPGDRVKIIERELSTLSLEQLELLSCFVQQEMSQRRLLDTNDRPKPKI